MSIIQTLVILVKIFNREKYDFKMMGGNIMIYSWRIDQSVQFSINLTS